MARPIQEGRGREVKPGILSVSQADAHDARKKI